MGYDPEISEWGNPAGVMPSHSRLNQIGRGEGTRGSETSKYPEEKKENSIPLVVASEEGRGQTRGLRTPGVAGHRQAKGAEPKTVGKRGQRA